MVIELSTDMQGPSVIYCGAILSDRDLCACAKCVVSRGEIRNYTALKASAKRVSTAPDFPAKSK